MKIIAPFNTLHKVYAINSNGKEKWEFATFGVVGSSPAIGPDGIIYIGSSDNNLYALYPNGTKKWAFATGNTIPQSSPEIGPDGTIYIGSTDNKMYAVNPNGTKKWEYVTGGAVYSSPAIGSDGTIYFGSSDAHLYALYPNGTKKWAFATYIGPSGGAVDSSPTIGSDGTIYVGSSNQRLYAIYPKNGTEKWEFITGNCIGTSTPAIGSDGTIYIGSCDRKMYAIYPNGQKKWEYLTGQVIDSAPAISADGMTYIGSGDHKFYAINPDSTEKWAVTTGDEVCSSPAIGSDGTIYFGSFDFNLYALGSLSTGSISVTVTGPSAGSNWYIRSQYNINWSITGGTLPYKTWLNYSTDGGITWSKISGAQGISGTTFTWTVPATPSTNCIIKAEVLDSTNNRTQNESGIFIIMPVSGGSPPNAPFNLTAFAGDQQITLTWEAPTTGSTPTGYNVKRSATMGGPYILIDNVTDTNYIDTGLINGNKYYYIVTATNIYGESVNSNEASATPQAGIVKKYPVPSFTYSQGLSTLNGENITITVRVAGKKWQTLNAYLFEGTSILKSTQIIRKTGSPDDQLGYLNFTMDTFKNHSVSLVYTSNGNGATPVWITAIYKSLSDTTKFTFNANSGFSQTQNVDLDSILSLMMSATTYVRFDASTSYDPDGYIVKYSWTFGDGGTANGKTVLYQYGKEGTYSVTLTTTDNDGLSNSTTQKIIVNGIKSDGYLKEINNNIYTSNKIQVILNGTVGVNITSRTEKTTILSGVENVNITGSSVLIYNGVKIITFPNNLTWTCYVVGEGNGGYEIKVIKGENHWVKEFSFSAATSLGKEENFTNSLSWNRMTIQPINGNKIYNIMIRKFVDITNNQTFKINGMRIDLKVTHIYTVLDWNNLSSTTLGTVTLGVDTNGDGVPEVQTPVSNGMTPDEVDKIIAAIREGQQFPVTMFFIGIGILAAVIVVSIAIVARGSRRQKKELIDKMDELEKKLGERKCPNCGAVLPEGVKECTKCIEREIDRQPMAIDEVFLMYNDGRLIRHETRRLKPDMDQDILASMLVAVQSFVKDAFRGEPGMLDEMRFGELTMQIGRGKYIIIAVLLSGRDKKGVRLQIMNAITDIETKHKEVLKQWDGNMEKVESLKDDLWALINGKYI